MSLAPVGRKTPAAPAGRVPLPRRPMLRLAPAPTRHAPRAPFLAVVFLLLAGGLVGLLLLNTTRAQDAFTLARLQNANAILLDQEQALRQVVQGDQDPARLAARAKALGMVPGGAPGYVDGHGKVVGAVPPGAPAPGPTSLVQQGVVIGVPGKSVPPVPTPPPAVRARQSSPPPVPVAVKNPSPKASASASAAASGHHPAPSPTTRPTSHPTAHPTSPPPVHPTSHRAVMP